MAGLKTYLYSTLLNTQGRKLLHALHLAFPLGVRNFNFRQLLMEAANKVIFLVVRPLRKKEFKKKLFILFVAVEKLNILCQRRHVEILIKVY